MKLYSKTTSNRASKGQGGDWLKIEITDENKKLLGVIDVFPADKNNRYGLISYKWLVDTNSGYQVKGNGILEANDTEVSDKRGERQKGEDDDNCKKCGGIKDSYESLCYDCQMKS